jgi:hypothetical protein
LVAWTSLLPAVATVDPAGVVTAVDDGTVRIVAASGAVADTAVITVITGGRTMTWAAAVSGDWMNPDRWVPNRAPRAADSVNITAAGAYSVSLDVPGAVTVDRLTVGSTDQDAIALEIGQTALGLESGGTVLPGGKVELVGGGILGSEGGLTIDGGEAVLAFGEWRHPTTLTSGEFRFEPGGSKVLGSSPMSFVGGVVKWQDPDSVLVLADGVSVTLDGAEFRIDEPLVLADDGSGDGGVDHVSGEIAFLVVAGLNVVPLYLDDVDLVSNGAVEVLTDGGVSVPAGTAFDLVRLTGTATFTGTPTNPSGDYVLAVNPEAGVGLRATSLTTGTVSVLVGNNQVGLVGFATNVRPAVTLVDGSNAPIPGAVVTFAIASGAGTLTDSVVTTDANGVAQVGAWELGPAPGANGLTASVGLAGITGNPVAFTASGAPPTYTIDFINIGPALSADAQLAFDSAKAHWERISYQDLPNASANLSLCGGTGTTTVDDLAILIEIDVIDGPGGILGQAGPCLLRSGSNLPAVGVMQFDVADVDALINSGQFDEVILHEMGHVIGIGTLWEIFNCLQLKSDGVGQLEDTYYSCSEGRIAFDSIGGTSYTGGNKVPVENTGGAGTRNGHWRESVFDNELMTGFLNGGVANPLSLLTSRSLVDLGYVVNFAGSEPYTKVFTAPPALVETGSRVDLGNDIRRGPIFVIDVSGRVLAQVR